LVAVGIPIARECGAQEGGDDTDEDGQQHSDGLLSGNQQAAENTDHHTDQDCADDSGNSHCSSKGRD